MRPRLRPGAARAVRAISGAQQQRKVRIPKTTIAPSRTLYPGVDPIATLNSTEKVELLGKVETLARAKDPRIVQVMAGLASEYDVVMVARADGTLAADVRPLVRLSVTVIAEQGDRREVGSSGGGGRFGLAYFSDEFHCVAPIVDLLSSVTEALLHAAQALRRRSGAEVPQHPRDTALQEVAGALRN
jgi:predicted Zn-dependent protease